jgi:hypothetical protein
MVRLIKIGLSIGGGCNAVSAAWVQGGASDSSVARRISPDRTHDSGPPQVRVWAGCGLGSGLWAEWDVQASSGRREGPAWRA